MKRLKRVLRQLVPDRYFLGRWPLMFVCLVSVTPAFGWKYWATTAAIAGIVIVSHREGAHDERRRREALLADVSGTVTCVACGWSTGPQQSFDRMLQASRTHKCASEVPA